MKNIWLMERYLHIEGKFHEFKLWQLEDYRTYPSVGTSMKLTISKPSQNLILAVDRLAKHEQARMPLSRPIVCTILCPEISPVKVLATLTRYKYNRHISLASTLEMTWWIVL